MSGVRIVSPEGAVASAPAALTGPLATLAGRRVGVLDPETQRYIKVYLPIIPTLIDAILHSGMRKRSGRWLDSGEFDEQLVDPGEDQHEGLDAGHARLLPR